MRVSSIVLKLVIPALALISVGLQFCGLNGCDIFRIHFKALNENGIYFNNDPWVGLGLSSHQTLVKTLSSGIMILHAACCFVSRTPLLSEKVKEVIFFITIAIAFVTALSLQVYAFDSLHSDGGVCDRDTYYPTAWNENFPFQTYPAYSYFKFFHKCSLGKDGKKIKATIALNGIIAFMATVIALFNLALILKSTNTDYMENTLKDTSPRNSGSALRSMKQNDDGDDGTVSADYPTDIEEN
ncbi:predicted protein [Chaetoceros tenuissimus]|uniref:Uncharacterized protein n=1 Tax=Chaetoceros tenuissimus TaxID=426638 RepID=A0AAD3CST9_9STRA|nr:predicted protein [Chaetoceros tenuissimus]